MVLVGHTGFPYRIDSNGKRSRCSLSITSFLLVTCSLYVYLIRKQIHDIEDVKYNADSTTEHEIDVTVTRVPH